MFFESGFGMFVDVAPDSDELLLKLFNVGKHVVHEFVPGSI
jgi:hypothetical protein